jgi:hypothetical protein
MEDHRAHLHSYRLLGSRPGDSRAETAAAPITNYRNFFNVDSKGKPGFSCVDAARVTDLCCLNGVPCGLRYILTGLLLAHLT